MTLPNTPINILSPHISIYTTYYQAKSATLMPQIVIKLMLSDSLEKLQVVNGREQCFNDLPLPFIPSFADYGARTLTWVIFATPRKSQ